MQVDEELHAIFNEQARQSSAFIYGRRMYELIVAYWPTAEDDPAATPAMQEFAGIWKDKPKIVVSRTLGAVDWNARLVRDDVVGEVSRLKARPGYDLDVGGPTTAAPLLRAGLVDEVRLFVQPVILGAGTPFFPPLEDPVGLELVDSQTLGPDRRPPLPNGQPGGLTDPARPGQVAGVSSVVVPGSAVESDSTDRDGSGVVGDGRAAICFGRPCPRASSPRPPWAARSRRSRRR